MEQAELEAWERKPDLFVGYEHGRDQPMTTWLGTPIGSVIASKQSLRRTRYGKHTLTYIIVKGTNGAYYRASFGDKTMAVRLHRIGRLFFIGGIHGE